MRRHPGCAAGFTALTFVLGALLIVVYLDRLTVLTPASPLVLLPAALTGFVVNPLWYVLLGLALRRGEMGVFKVSSDQRSGAPPGPHGKAGTGERRSGGGLRPWCRQDAPVTNLEYTPAKWRPLTRVRRRLRE